jgi:nitrite reductase/ring-hydroxylating ferredoxin subunit
MDLVPVARLEDIPRGAARVFAAGGVRVLLARVEDAVYALQPACPHRGCDWDGARLEGEVLACPRCRFRYSARSGLNPLTTACHVNQSTAEYHYRNFPEGRADVHDVRVAGGEVAVSRTPRRFRKVVV